MLRTTASFLSHPGEDTKPGHPKRELCKACLHFLIALFCSTTRTCVIYTQAEPGHPRSCLTLPEPFREGFGIFLATSCPLLLKKGTLGISVNKHSPYTCLLCRPKVNRFWILLSLSFKVLNTEKFVIFG